MGKDEQVIKPVGIGSVSAVGELTLKMRPNLYEHMYEIAKEHRDKAIKIGGKDFKGETKESMISILFSCICLEAYINKIAVDELGVDWLKRNRSLESKWKRVSYELATRKAGVKTSPFSDSKEPFKSFGELINIRNKIIVHNKAEFMDVVQTKYGNMDGTINFVNCDIAEKSCKVVTDMVTGLNKYIDNPPQHKWCE